MYVQTLTSGIMEAVADIEAAIVAALGHKYTLKRADPPAQPMEQPRLAPGHHAEGVASAQPTDDPDQRHSSSFGGKLDSSSTHRPTFTS